MFHINNSGIISLNRGDSFKVPLFINMGTDTEPVRVDLHKFPYLEVYMGIMLPHQTFETAIIKKKFTVDNANDKGDVVVNIEPAETMNLRPGKYFYEIKARLDDPIEGEYVRTVINKTQFLVLR